MKNKINNQSCPVCGSNQTSDLEHNLSLCSSCTHIFQTDMKIEMVYDKDYIDSRYNEAMHPINDMAFLRAGYVLSSLRDLGKDDGINILDIGYGTGAFLKAIGKKPGCNIYGMDIHKEDRGIQEVDFDTQIKFDVVTFFDSLEHFSSFKEISKLSSKKMVISIPRYPESFLLSPSTWRHYRPGEHLHYFSSQSLTTLMRLMGYEFESESDVEDLIRGRCPHNGSLHQNISTFTFNYNKQS